MASGWAKDGAVQEQVDQTVNDGVDLARAKLGSTAVARETCVECGEPIPPARQEAVPGVQFCVDCQSERDAADTNGASTNRRASKDALLR